MCPCSMLQIFLIFSSTLIVLSLLITPAATLGINIPIHRRGGRFTKHDIANFTRLEDLLRQTETRYSRTYRDVGDNSLVRGWASSGEIIEHDGLLASIFDSGSWYAQMNVGEPSQSLEADLDMLSPDFYALMTTSGKGSNYDTFLASSHINHQESIHALCQKPSDLFHLHGVLRPVRMTFPTCKAPHTSRHTLLPSGTIVGLGPAGSLTRLAGHSLLDQFHAQSLISSKIWSITLLDSENGILSMGGTIAKEVETAKIQAALELDNFGNDMATPEWISQQTEEQLVRSMSDLLPFDSHFKWAELHGAAGWWTALISSVWVNNAKVLKNQPVLFDVQCPFILAPPSAIATFYQAIGGTVRLAPPHDRFFAFPCPNGNSISIAFEIGGWSFPALAGQHKREDGLHGPTGGRFSLGEMGNGTGYCVGIVVETRNGEGQGGQGSGLKEAWVLGEPFFRGMGMVFDAEGQRIGLRSY